MVEDDCRALRIGQDGQALSPRRKIDVRRCFFGRVGGVIEAVVNEGRLRVALDRARPVPTEVESDRPYPWPYLEIADAIFVV